MAISYLPFLFVVLACLTALTGYSQPQDTSYLLETVEVTGEIFPIPHSRQLDSSLIALYPLGGIEQLLSYSNAAAVRSYGPGQLSTASINGLGGQHTAIVWEGFNLQSSMNGVLDLGLLPLFQGQQLSLAEGGRSASLGSGAMAGALLLGSGNKSRHQAGLTYQFSSIARHQSGLQFSIPSQIINNQTRLFFTYQENRFSFRNTSRQGDPVEKTAPTPGRIGGIQQHFSWSQGTHSLGLDLWYQQAERRLRPSLIAADLRAEQDDEMLNVAVNWKNQLGDGLLKAKSGFFLEKIHYRQESGDIQTRSEARRWVNRLDYQLENQNRISFRTGLKYSLAEAGSEAFPGNPVQQQLSGFTGFSLPLAKGYLSAHFRLNHLIESGEWTWAAEVNWKRDLKEWGHIDIRFSRDFRIPTLNDLYWTPGGNPDLSSEFSRHASLKWTVERKIDASNRIRFGISPYFYLVDNWILWRPNPETGIWQPENLQKVWSRGFEGEAGWSQQLDKWKWSATFRYRLGKATIEQSASSGQGDLKKQLIYTPQQQGSASLSILTGRWRFQYVHQYTGRRYISSDNRNYLPAYQLGAFHLQRKWSIGKRMSGNVQLSVENCWNTHYQSIAYFPEPLRYIRLGVQAQFSGKE
jgi:iron complex outermembrane receptor protein